MIVRLSGAQRDSYPAECLPILSMSLLPLLAEIAVSSSFIPWLQQERGNKLRTARLRAWKYFETFDSATNCRAWLFRILRNVWISRWRKSRLELPLTETGEEQIEPYYDWEDEFLHDEMSAEVERALSELPADYRLTILLADVEELTYQEIARVMECPIGTVMSRLNRGRKMLARLIRTYGEGRGSKPEEFVRRKT